MSRTGWLGALVVVGFGCGVPDAEVSAPKGASAGARSLSAQDPGPTRYPIVLAHGLAGFSQLFGGIEYWNGVAQTLQAQGHTVFTNDVSAMNSSEERGQQLLDQVEQIVAQTGCGQVNLIGHSQGGLDARYVLAHRPDLLASVTTVGTPHQGSDVADFLRGNITPGGFTELAVATLGDAAGALAGLLSGYANPQDAVAALDNLTSQGMAAFNSTYPEGLPDAPCGQGPAKVEGVALFSWSGTAPFTNALDWSDNNLLGPGSLVFAADNDGLVGKCSSHFGTVIRDDYVMNHLDEVNQLVGLVSPFSEDPLALFRDHAQRLRAAGL